MEQYKPWIFFIVATFGIATSIASFIVKYKISRLDREIARLEREISNTEAEARVFATESAHLATVTRIRVMSARFLPQFKNISQGDVRKIVDIPIDPAFE